MRELKYRIYNYSDISKCGTAINTIFVGSGLLNGIKTLSEEGVTILNKIILIILIMIVVAGIIKLVEKCIVKLKIDITNRILVICYGKKEKRINFTDIKKISNEMFTLTIEHNEGEIQLPSFGRKLDNDIENTIMTANNNYTEIKKTQEDLKNGEAI